MTGASPGEPRPRAELRRVGAALGLAGGPSAAFGQGWAHTGDAGLHVWLIASLAAAVLGALTLPFFYRTREESLQLSPEGDGPGPGFGALFGLSVGIVAGCFSAFPMGAVMGGVGGLFGAAAGGLLWRKLGAPVTAIVAAAVGLIAPILWVG